MASVFYSWVSLYNLISPEKNKTTRLVIYRYICYIF